MSEIRKEIPVTVKITTVTSGEKMITRAGGKYHAAKDGYVVLYTDRSENGVTENHLKAQETGMSIFRRGSVGGAMHFRPGEHTQALFEAFGRTAHLKVHTRNYIMKRLEDGLVMEIVYDLYDGGSVMGVFELKIEVTEK